MAVAQMTTRGRVTIPESVRDRLGLRAGDRVELRFDGHGRLLVEKVNDEESP